MLSFKRPALCAALFGIATAASVLGAANPARAQGDTPLVAYLAANGEVTVRNANTGKTMATIRPGLFEQTWQMRGLSPTGAFGAPDENQTKSSIKATTSGATVDVQSRVSLAAPNVLHFVLTMTPNKPLKTNSVHVSLEVPSGDWVGGTTKLATGAPVPIPSAAKQTQIIGGGGAISLQKNGKTLSADAKDKSGMVQDNRVFGNAGLEMRFGTQQDGGGLWPAGKTETFDVTVTLPEAVTIVRQAPITLSVGKEWIPLQSVLDIAPGSALDFSALLLDAPAGKYGRVLVRPDGHFGFAGKPDPARFYGVNFAFSANYLTHDEADRVAERLARIGYNSVRIHHHDGELVDTKAANTTTFRADSLDKLDYLIYALKKRGLYLTTDMFVSRPVKDEETGLANGASDFKAALLVSPAAMENWKTFSRNFLTHVNPYTKLAYKDDPAIAFISVVNEPNLGGSLGGMTGALRNAYQSEYNKYLASRYKTDADLQAAWNNTATRSGADLPKNVDTKTPEGRDVAAFLVFIHERGYQTMSAFLKNEIGTQALLTDNNGWSEMPALMAARTHLDYVDNHFYWDHPSFLENQWSLPSRGWSGGGSALGAAGAGPNGIAQTRLMGKPFVVTEYDYVAPNAFRAEGALLMGAAAALQDWDGVWQFAYSHGHDASLSPTPIDYFNMANDPGRQAAERAALMLFLRGDVKPAPSQVTLVRKQTDLETPGPQTASPASGFGDLALVTRVGTYVQGGNPLPPQAKNETRLNDGTNESVLAAMRSVGTVPQTNRTDLENGSRESETGQIFVDGAKTSLLLQTPKTVGGIAGPGETIKSGPVSIAVKGARAAVWASSLDNLPLSKSRRMLLVHVTDVENTGMTFSGPDKQVLTDWGTLPYIVRNGSATLSFSDLAPGKLSVYRLDTSGKRIAPVGVAQKGNTAAFTVSTLEPGATGATLYYELVITNATPAKSVTIAPAKGRVSGGNGLQ